MEHIACNVLIPTKSASVENEKTKNGKLMHAVSPMETIGSCMDF